MNDTNDMDGEKIRENIMTYVITLMQTPIITISKKPTKKSNTQDFFQEFHVSYCIFLDDPIKFLLLFLLL